jgi:hypothetical protein
VFAYRFGLPGAYKEGHIPSSLSQTAAEIATDGAGADYQDSHRRIMWDSYCRLQSRGAEWGSQSIGFSVLVPALIPFRPESKS